MSALKRWLAEIERRVRESRVLRGGCGICTGMTYALLFADESGGTPTRLMNGQPLPEKCPGCGGKILDAEPPLRMIFSVDRDPNAASAAANPSPVSA